LGRRPRGPPLLAAGAARASRGGRLFNRPPDLHQLHTLSAACAVAHGSAAARAAARVDRAPRADGAARARERRAVDAPADGERLAAVFQRAVRQLAAVSRAQALRLNADTMAL